MSKKESVTIRMSSENVESLKRYSREENVSQGKFIEKLIENYNGKNNNHTLKNTTEKGKIEYLLRYENYFLKDKEKQFRDSIKYAIVGECVYALQKGIEIPIKEVKNLLKDDFKIDEDLEKYTLTYWFAIVRDAKKDRYIINEIFDIRINESIKAMLNVSRCKIALNLYDIRKHIEGYVPTHILADIEKYLVEVTEDDNILERFLD